ncbi:MAG: cytochrome c biogenesis protein CcmE, partial [Sphingomonadales bacterium 17-56-6]
MKPKHQRLLLAAIAVVALVGAGLIAASALREEASYFYTPTTLASANVPPGKAIRLGGMVQKGSIVHGADGVSITFTVQDQERSQKVAYRGIT